MTRKIELLAFSGYAGSGKDAAATVLVENGWRRVAFADKLRQVAYALDPIIPGLDGTNYRLARLVDAYGWEVVKRRNPEVRRLLQRLGTEGGREVLGQDVWVNAALQNLDGPTVITDCRFISEADRVRDLGGVVFRIERPGVGPLVGADGQIHPSETALDGYPFDGIIQNTGTVEELGGLVLDGIAWLQGAT